MASQRPKTFKNVATSLQRFRWVMLGVQVYALTGKSGTGKSYKAKLIAEKYNIDIIIDDGLIIRDNQVLVGHSAKRERNYLQAVRVALFDAPEARQAAIVALENSVFHRILILGTSVKMVMRIAEHLNLPEVSKFLTIEEISTPEEIAMALRSREAGNHVIPVPVSAIKDDYAHILYDKLLIFLIKRGFLKKKSSEVIEKSIVRPVFHRMAEESTPASAPSTGKGMIVIIKTIVKSFDNSFKISKIRTRADAGGGLHVHFSLGAVPGYVTTAKVEGLRQLVLNELIQQGYLCQEVHIAFKYKKIPKKKVEQT